MVWLLFGWLRDATFGLVLLLALSVVAREGFSGLARRVFVVLKMLPGVGWLIRAVLRREVRGFLRQVERDAGREHVREHGKKKTMTIPENGNDDV